MEHNPTCEQCGQELWQMGAKLMHEVGGYIQTECPMAPKPSPSELCTCSACGYGWPRGTDGSHSCTQYLQAEVRKLCTENEALKNERNSTLTTLRGIVAGRAPSGWLGEQMKVIIDESAERAREKECGS